MNRNKRPYNIYVVHEANNKISNKSEAKANPNVKNLLKKHSHTSQTAKIVAICGLFFPTRCCCVCVCVCVVFHHHHVVRLYSCCF